MLHSPLNLFAELVGSHPFAGALGLLFHIARSLSCAMASNVENYSENDMAMAGAENDMADAENDIIGSENDMAGAENDIYGDNEDVEGAENDITETENNMPGAEKNLNGTENAIGGIDNVVDGDDINIAGPSENTENQQGHNVEVGVKSSEKKWPGWPGENVFRILVPTHKVGGIIGRKGEFIKKMCVDSKSRIKVLECPPGAQERAVLISAREEPDATISPAMDGLLRIHKRTIDGLEGEDPAPQNAGNREVTRLLAGATQAASLIGKHGSTIKSIQEASNCVIRVTEDVPPFALQDDKVVEIQGEPTGMHKALELIASHLRKFLVDRSVIPLFEINMQRPISHMQQNMPPPHQPWGHPHGPPPNAGGSGYAGNSQFMPPRQHDNFYPPPEHPPFEKPPHYGISAFGRDVPPMGGHPSNSQHGQPLVHQVTHHMQVPISFADAVIGAAGANISYIRRASGATITIQETRGVPGEMTVEINGSATQVQAAQQLIQNYMAEAGAPAQNTAPPPSDYGYSSSYPPQQSYGTSAYAAAAPEVNAGAAAPPGGGYGGNYASYGASYGY